MATQQPPRPWFRLASMMRPTAPAPAPAPPPPTRPPAPTTVLQPPPPLPPFRPPVALPQPSTQPQEPPRPPPPPPPVASPPPPQATAPTSPVQLPARLSLPIASPPSASRSPFITSPAPRSPVGVPTPAAAPEPPSQVEPNKPESPIISTTPSDSTTRQVVSSSSLPPSPKTNAASAAPSSPQLPTSPAPKTLLSFPAPQPPPPSPSPARIPSPYITSGTAPPPPSPARNSSPSITTVAAPPLPSPVRPKSVVPSPNAIKQWDRKTPPPPDRSPILKALSHPPSPLILPPPAQLKPEDSDYLEPIPAEAEQKTVLMQNIIKEKPPKLTTLNTSYNNGNFHSNKNGGEVKKDTTSTLSKKTSTNSSEDQFGMRIVTLAGENKGAVMELSSPSRKKATATNNALKFHGSGRVDDDEDGKNAFRKMQSQPPAPMDAFVNSNVQGANNSILYNCVYTNRDPGVHLSVSRNGNAGRGAPRGHGRS